MRFFRKCLKKDIKNGRAEPFFQFLVLKLPFFGTFHKSSDKFPHFTSKPLGAIPKPWEQPPIAQSTIYTTESLNQKGYLEKQVKWFLKINKENIDFFKKLMEK